MTRSRAFFFAIHRKLCGLTVAARLSKLVSWSVVNCLKTRILVGLSLRWGSARACSERVQTCFRLESCPDRDPPSPPRHIQSLNYREANLTQIPKEAMQNGS
jgi:hypothetical protein